LEFHCEEDCEWESGCDKVSWVDLLPVLTGLEGQRPEHFDECLSRILREIGQRGSGKFMRKIAQS
jgi:hypothetical protein